jgi:hypothetical protein
LNYIYRTIYTKAYESENYFKKFGGNNWLGKYHSSKPYKYYQECIVGNVYKETLQNLIINAYIDLSKIIENENYKIEEYYDIYYTYEQFEFILRSMGEL